MQLTSYYDEAYRRLRQVPMDILGPRAEREGKRMFDLVEEARVRFLGGTAWPSLKILDCGGAPGGVAMQLARMGAQVTLVDFASEAIALADALARHQGLSLRTVQADVAQPDAQLAETYHLIIDHHLLHCLPSTPERFSFHRFMQDHLRAGGVVVGETMAHRKKLFMPPGWRLDDEKVLWQQLADWVPVRRIADSLELEDEFNRAGWKIVFFYYYGNYGVAPAEDFWDIPADILPAAVRYVLTR